MEEIVKRVKRGAIVWVCDCAGRGGGQAMTTVITLICAGQQSRCRMTVSRPPSWPHTGGVGHNHKGYTRILGNSVCPTHDRRGHIPPSSCRRGILLEHLGDGPHEAGQFTRHGHDGFGRADPQPEVTIARVQPQLRLPG